MVPPLVKRSRKRITIQEKLDAIAKVENGWPQKSVAEHYDVSVQVMFDIMNTRLKLLALKNTGI